MNETRVGITYGDVLIEPQYSDIPSRTEINVNSFYLGNYRTPIMSAPMDTVSGPDMVCGLAKVGAYGVLHRFGSPEELYSNAITASLQSRCEFGVAIGVKPDALFGDKDTWHAWLKTINDLRVHSICIDVAHGHHALVIEMLQNLFEEREKHGYKYKIIAGNVATGIGFLQLARAGADAVRVGIGPGAACTTRETTGVGVPQLTAIMDCDKVRHEFTPTTDLIADGGIQVPGDIAKALAAGADAVMLGKMLAGADESLAPNIDNQYKVYRGQSTVGSNGLRGAPEGIEGRVPLTGPVGPTVDTLMQYLRSSMSYVGARDLTEFRQNVNFIQVSPATVAESSTRLGEHYG